MYISITKVADLPSFQYFKANTCKDEQRMFKDTGSECFWKPHSEILNTNLRELYFKRKIMSEAFWNTILNVKTKRNKLLAEDFAPNPSHRPLAKVPTVISEPPTRVVRTRAVEECRAFALTHRFLWESLSEDRQELRRAG